MAQLNYQADFNETEQSFDPVPAGEYLAVIENSDYLPNKKGTGMTLKLTYQIIDGPQKGRKVFEQLNLENQNKQAEAIARKSLNSICKACNVQNLQDSAQLHNVSFVIDVRMKESAEYGMQNVIKKHEAIDGEKPPVQAAPVNAGTDNFNAPAKKKPWEK